VAVGENARDIEVKMVRSTNAALGSIKRGLGGTSKRQMGVYSCFSKSILLFSRARGLTKLSLFFLD
jgi:hypothetical protein